MIFIQWTNAAFRELEVLPEETAFEIIRQVDFLIKYPEMGAPLETRFSRLKNLRQIIIRRHRRVVYEFESEKETLYILAVQHCRQKLPPVRELKRRKREVE